MFHMNNLHLAIAVSIALMVIFIIAGISAIVNIRISARQKQKDIEDKTHEMHTRITKRLTCVYFILFFISLIVTAFIADYYYKHGAFYDNAWRDANVDDHFIWDISDTEFLQTIYDSTGPEEFKPELYNVILVRLGCKDCEKVKDALLSAKDEGEIYIIFSRSEIGQVYAKRYNVEYVPCAILDNIYVPLYDEESVHDTANNSTE